MSFVDDVLSERRTDVVYFGLVLAKHVVFSQENSVVAHEGEVVDVLSSVDHAGMVRARVRGQEAQIPANTLSQISAEKAQELRTHHARQRFCSACNTLRGDAEVLLVCFACAFYACRVCAGLVSFALAPDAPTAQCTMKIDLMAPNSLELTVGEGVKPLSLVETETVLVLRDAKAPSRPMAARCAQTGEVSAVSRALLCARENGEVGWYPMLVREEAATRFERFRLTVHPSNRVSIGSLGLAPAHRAGDSPPRASAPCALFAPPAHSARHRRPLRRLMAATLCATRARTSATRAAASACPW